MRERIRGLGYEVADEAGGWRLTAAAVPRLRAGEVPSRLADEPTHDVSVQWLPSLWPEDVARGIGAFERHSGERRVQHVVVEDESSAAAAWSEGVEVVRLAGEPGFAVASNAGLRRASGRIVVLADGSVEPTGDVLGPLERALSDPSVGICGPFGLVTRDLRDFHETRAAEVDAIEGYLMALRRELLEDGLELDPGFRFYRMADVDLSFRVKAMGLRLERLDLPLLRHEHRTWASLAPGERERLSKRSFYRFLDRWRGRTDLLVSR